MSDPVAPVAESQMDWEVARAFLKGRIAAQLRTSDAAVVEDLTQESLVRLLRAIRREGARNLEALMTVVARRTVTDHIRGEIRWRVFRESFSRETGANPLAPPIERGDPVANLRFAMLEFFQSHDSPCAELARSYFEVQKWKTVAERLQRSHDAVRKQWSRCIALLRDAVRRDPDVLWGLLEEENPVDV